MADVADIANDRAADELSERLANRVQFTGVSSSHCEDCDEEIPPLRRQTLSGVTTCVDCQQMREDRRR